MQHTAAALERLKTILQWIMAVNTTPWNTLFPMPFSYPKADFASLLFNTIARETQNNENIMVVFLKSPEDLTVMVVIVNKDLDSLWYDQQTNDY